MVMEVSRLFGLGKWFVLEEVLDGTAELQSLDVPVSKAESAILGCQVESHDHQIAQAPKRKNKKVAFPYSEQFVGTYEHSMLNPKTMSPIKIGRGQGRWWSTSTITVPK